MRWLRSKWTECSLLVMDPKVVSTIYINGKPAQRLYEPPPPRIFRTYRKRPLNDSKLMAPKLKIRRARKHLEELSEIITAFYGRRPFEVVSDTDAQTGECVFRLKITEGAPQEVSSIVGDVVHNLRSALDVLVCDLIRAAGATVTPSSAFPVASSKLTFPNFANGRLKGVVPAARRLVARLKPYPHGDAALWNIHSLNGIDKHNRIIVAEAATMEILAMATMPFFFSTRTGGFQIGGGSSADAVPFEMGRGVPENYQPIFPLRDGSEIYRGPAGFTSEVQCGVYLAFGQGEVLAGEPVQETLKQYTDMVERIVSMFERFA